ncbi:MAG: 30S ribosome-binding factor RbfA [Anaerovoracaceae bacterium]|nr:30S ribosome-binding factor RbfA [Bacillota bacterium]MDY2671367.1 30S ribosome-binding factor RbfA [Anaerovoracaceae bacterium]
MAKSYRKGRLGEEIKKIISDMLLKDLKDPRLTGKMISITDVDVSPDGSYATVYITVLGSSISGNTPDDEKKEAIEGLTKASGHIRKTIGRRVKIRHVPELTFKVDESLEYGRHMSAVLDSLHISKEKEPDGSDDDGESDFAADEDSEKMTGEKGKDPDDSSADEAEETSEAAPFGEIDYSETGENGVPVTDKYGYDLTPDDYQHFRPAYVLEPDDRTADMARIADLLRESESMYIFPHYVADGDAIGSCASLCCMMRRLGKEADILMEDEIPDNLRFMDKNYIKYTDDSENLPKRDLCIALDCSNFDRFPKRQRLFSECGRHTACIDHHLAHVEFAEVNLIDPDASATAEIMYELYLYMGLELNPEACEAIYAGIATDTGNFQYTNTTRKTHLITADLYAQGIDTKKVNIILYQSDRPQKLRLHAMIMSHMQIFCGGRASIAYVTLAMYQEADAKTSESDGINSAIRDIKGVEVAVFLREKHEHEIKVGFRSKDYIDVSSICVKFGGGGHAHAAGCTMLMTMDETIPVIMDAVEEALKQYDLDHPEKAALLKGAESSGVTGE